MPQRDTCHFRLLKKKGKKKEATFPVAHASKGCLPFLTLDNNNTNFFFQKSSSSIFLNLLLLLLLLLLFFGRTKQNSYAQSKWESESWKTTPR